MKNLEMKIKQLEFHINVLQEEKKRYGVTVNMTGAALSKLTTAELNHLIKQVGSIEMVG